MYRRRPCALREQGYRACSSDLLGEEGRAVESAPHQRWIAKPPSVEVVSTVGAGDLMVGGTVYGLLMRESSEHTCAWRPPSLLPRPSARQCNYRPYPVGRDDGARRLTTL